MNDVYHTSGFGEFKINENHILSFDLVFLYRMHDPLGCRKKLGVASDGEFFFSFFLRGGGGGGSAQIVAGGSCGLFGMIRLKSQT